MRELTEIARQRARKTLSEVKQKLETALRLSRVLEGKMGSRGGRSKA
jgi:hypothetical protein